jgi:hypothetical protein
VIFITLENKEKIVVQEEKNMYVFIPVVDATVIESV